MRTVILLALFALATNALNYTAYNYGTAQQLGISDEVFQQGIPCFTDLTSGYEQFIQVLQTGNIGEIVAQAAVFYFDLQNDVTNTCLPYITGVQSFIGQFINITDDMNSVMQQNFELYYPEVIQQVAVWINNLAAGNEYQAGQAKGVVTQILLGLTTPSVLPDPQLNFSNVEPFNQTVFVSEYFQAILSGLGNNMTIDTDSLNDCLIQVENATIMVKSSLGAFSNLSFSDKVQIVGTYFDIVGDTIKDCEVGAEISMAVIDPIFDAFVEDPIGFVVQFADNTALSLPQIIHSLKQELVDMEEGEYTFAGLEEVERLMIIFGSFVNFNDSN